MPSRGLFVFIEENPLDKSNDFLYLPSTFVLQRHLPMLKSRLILHLAVVRFSKSINQSIIHTRR
jgi:hypothetical protein